MKYKITGMDPAIPGADYTTYGMRRDPTHPDSALSELIRDLNKIDGRRSVPRLSWDTYFQVFCTYFYNLGKTGARPEDRTAEVMSLHHVWQDKEQR